MPSVSVVVPCFREADNLVALHRQISESLSDQFPDWELILVDDGSPDDSAVIAAGLAALDERVRAVRLSRNFGKEAAMLAGLHRARADIVVLMDADLQHPPELLPQLAERVQDGADQVIARRDRSGDPALRTALSRLFYRFSNAYSDVELVDGAGDFRALSRRAVDAVLAMDESSRFSKGLFAWIGLEQEIIAYPNVGRASGQSSWSFGRLIGYALDGALAFTTKPLRIATWCGALTCGAALIYFVWLVWNVIIHGVDAPGYVTLVALITGLSGVQLLCLGVLGEYVGRTFMQVKNRPHYIVAGDSGASDRGPAR